MLTIYAAYGGSAGGPMFHWGLSHTPLQQWSAAGAVMAQSVTQLSWETKSKDSEGVRAQC